MSQTETLMLFFLGFCAALLIILMFGRVAWSLLGRWSGWQQKRQVPIAIRELQAVRDSLKAEKAIMARKLESGVSDMKMRLAEQMAEVSRNRNRVLDLTAKLTASQNDVSALNVESRDKVDQIAALNVQIQENVKAIDSAWAKVARHETEIGKLKQLQSHADSVLVNKDQRIANLENESKALRDIVAMFVPRQATTDQLQMPISSSENRLREISSEFGEANFGISTASTERLVASNSFQARFNSGGNPFETSENTKQSGFSAIAQGNITTANKIDTVESDEIAKGVSNVLSLAERFRGLQNGVKK